MYYRGNHKNTQNADVWIYPLVIGNLCASVMIGITGGFLFKALSKIRQYLKEEGEIKDRINIKTLVTHLMAFGILILGLVVFVTLMIIYDMKDGGN